MRRIILLMLTMSLLLLVPTGAGAGVGFGTPVGNFSGCPAKTLDKSTLPLIVILLKGGTPYAWYNVSQDRGTTSYHFDVPVGRYQLMSTYTGVQHVALNVEYGKSPRNDFKISCALNSH